MKIEQIGLHAMFSYFFFFFFLFLGFIADCLDLCGEMNKEP